MQQFIKRYFFELFTKSEFDSQIKEWSRPENRQRIHGELDQLWQHTQTHLPDPDENEQREYRLEAQRLLQRVCNKQHSAQRAVTIPLRWLHYSAAVVLLCVVSLGAFRLWSVRDPEPMEWLTVQVPYGSHQQMTLADGTTVVLNAGSKLTYPETFRGERRQVSLDGEAYFNVARNERQPFEIRAGQAHVVVLGTSFNLKAFEEDDQLNVSVERGKVQVNMPEGMARLTANEQLVFNKPGGGFSKQTEKAEHALAWVNGGFYFHRTPLQCVANELRRRYNQEITLAEGVDHRTEISGEIENKDLKSILNAVCFATGLKHRQRLNGTEIYKP